MAGIPKDEFKWKPGASANPSGRPKGGLSRVEAETTIGRLFKMTRQELQDVVQDPKSSMLIITLASIMAKAAKDGDAARLEFLLNRSIGRVKDMLEIEHKKLDHLTDKEVIELAKEQIQALEAKTVDI